MARVVICEDHEKMREVMLASFKAAGIEVLAVVSDGLAALAETERLAPDVVVTGARMPGLDADGLVATLEAHHQAARVVVCTAAGPDALSRLGCVGSAILVDKVAGPRAVVEAVFSAVA